MSAHLELVVSDDDPTSPLASQLREIEAMYPEDPMRLRLTAAIAQWWAQKMIEEAAVTEDYQRRERIRRQRLAERRTARS